MLVWPAVAVLGFLAVAGLVVALGRSSTARYEFERNRAREAEPQRTAAGPPHGVGAGSRAVGDGPRPGGSAGGGPAPERRPLQRAAVGLATHPAGTGTADPGSAVGWWLVDGSGEQPGRPVVAGPFPDRIAADWAALSGGLHGSIRAAYGACGPGGGLVRRQTPQDRAWLSELEQQLDRLPEDWNGLVSDSDTLTTLVVEVTAALWEAGLPLHDCAGGGAAGGVYVLPDPGHRGLLVSWRQHDRMSVQQVRSAAVEASVQRTMNAAVSDVLVQLGFRVEPLGAAGCHLVTDAPR